MKLRFYVLPLLVGFLLTGCLIQNVKKNHVIQVSDSNPEKINANEQTVVFQIGEIKNSIPVGKIVEVQSAGSSCDKIVGVFHKVEDKDLNLVTDLLSKFKGSFTPLELEKKVSSFLKDTKTSIDVNSKYLISKGLEIERSQDAGSFFIRGIGNLMKNNQEMDIDNLNNLLNDIETGKIAKKLIQALKKSTGVQIFIGSNTNLFKQSNMSMILSNYTTKQGITGAVGIIGPKRLDYQKIIPIISYMSEVISKK